MTPLQTMKQQKRITMPHLLKKEGKQSQTRNAELTERKSTHENNDSYKQHSMECGLPTGPPSRTRKIPGRTNALSSGDLCSRNLAKQKQIICVERI
jgi:hypothetical protein